MSKQRYSKEFKLEAVRLMRQPAVSVQQVADDLGVNINSLYAWRKQFEELELPSDEKTEKDLEIERLKRELKDAKETIEILEAASKYFAGKSGKRR